MAMLAQDQLGLNLSQIHLCMREEDLQFQKMGYLTHHTLLLESEGLKSSEPNTNNNNNKTM